jgi:hypothetical protein
VDLLGEYDLEGVLYDLDVAGEVVERVFTELDLLFEVFFDLV